MHRTLVRLFSSAIALLLLAAPAFSVEEEAGLRLATFTCNVTPPLAGHPLIWVTPVAEVETPLLAKGIVLDDGARRYVLCAIDWCGLCNSSYELFRSKIAAAAETEVTQVAVHCIHQHTAPYTDGDAQRLLDKLDKDENLPLYVDFEFLDDVPGFARERLQEKEGIFQIYFTGCAGDVYILHLPGECMVEFQLFAQRSKPGALVAVAAYGDVGPGYICTERSFSEGGYEPTASRVAPRSEALLKKAIRKLLAAD